MHVKAQPLWVNMEIHSLSISTSSQLSPVKEKSFVIHLYNPSGKVRRLFLSPREAIFSTKALQNHSIIDVNDSGLMVGGGVVLEL